MNAIATFTFAPSLALRAIDRDGEPWFVAKDVCTALGYRNTTDTLKKHVDADDKAIVSLGLSGSAPTLINESGMYALIFGSKKEEARRFKRFVTREVLPSIRKRGAYMTDEVANRVLAHADEAVRLAQAQLAESQARLVVEHARANALTAQVAVFQAQLSSAKAELSMHHYNDRRESVAEFVLRHPEYVWTANRRYELGKFAGQLTDSYGLKTHIELRASANPRHSRAQLYPPELLDRALKQMPWYGSPQAGLPVEEDPSAGPGPLKTPLTSGTLIRTDTLS